MSLEFTQMYTIVELQEMFLSYLQENPFLKKPNNLYAPIDYILGIGGKRIRPILTLAGYNLFDQEVSQAMPAALAVEVFHNFSLMHDDIMDEAELRRGEPSVHVKYDDNTAILSGDVMLLLTNKILSSYPQPLFYPLFNLYNKNAILICEGQQMDMDFEQEDKVEIADYIQMIENKTAVLLGVSLQMGGIIAGAGESDQKHLFEFGRNLGIAFQLKDDLMDSFADPSKFGKKVGGDIVQGKKTYLFLKTLELLSKEESMSFESLYYSKTKDHKIKVDEVKSTFKAVNVIEYTNQLIEAYTILSKSHLDQISVNKPQKLQLYQMIESLSKRQS